jgi:hypothetical protein
MELQPRARQKMDFQQDNTGMNKQTNAPAATTTTAPTMRRVKEPQRFPSVL